MASWDKEIDEVARRMTDGAPDAGFTARVLARIDADEPRWWTRRSAWAWSPIALAVAVAIVLAIVWRPWRSTAPTTLTPTGRIAGTQPPPPAPIRTPGAGGVRSSDAGRAGVAPVRAAAASAGRGFSEPSRVLAPPDTASVTGAFDAPAPPAAIAIEPLGVDLVIGMDSIQLPSVDVAPLTVPPLTLGPIEGAVR